MELLEQAVQISIIGGAVWGMFSYAALRPLNASISRLENAVAKLDAQLARMDDRQRNLEIHVAEIDQRAKSAHHRIDVIDKHLDIQRGDDH